MELERFFRWTVVALAAFGVMLVSAGVFGTMLVRPREKAVVTDAEQQLAKAAGAESSSQSERGWGEPDEHLRDRHAGGQLEGGKESTDEPDQRMDEPEMPKQPERRTALTESPPIQHNQPMESLPNPSPADGNDGRRAVLKERPNGDTNRPTAVKSAPKTEKASVVASAHGKEPRPGRTGGTESAAGVATVRTFSPDDQPDVGENEGTEAAAVSNPGENETEAPED